MFTIKKRLPRAFESYGEFSAKHIRKVSFRRIARF